MFNNSVPGIFRIAPGFDRLLFGGPKRSLTVAIMDGLGPQKGINPNYAFVPGGTVESVLRKIAAGGSFPAREQIVAIVMKPEERDRLGYERDSTVIPRYEDLIRQYHPELPKQFITQIDRRAWYGLAAAADFVLGTDDEAPYANILIRIEAGAQPQLPKPLSQDLVEAMLYCGHGNRIAICGGNSPVARLEGRLASKIVRSPYRIEQVAGALSTVWDPDTDYEHVSPRVGDPIAACGQISTAVVEQLSPRWRETPSAVISNTDFELETLEWWTAAVVFCADESAEQLLFTNGVTRPDVIE